MINKINSINNDLLNKEIDDIFAKMIEKKYHDTNGLLVSYEFNEEYSVFNENTFNIFTSYSKQINILYREIANLLKLKNESNNLNSEKSMQHISGKIFDLNNINKEYYYDYSSQLPGSYYGIYIINSNESSIMINEENLDVKDNSIIMITGKDKILFNNINNNFKAIEFYILPLHYLNGQYYQKWCPILC
jgi:hypothetical protein